jgi:hypothetical protein
MLKPIAIFFFVYFLISAMVYADTEVNLPCDSQRMGMIDSDQRNPGCDKGELDDYLKELFKPKEQYDI